MRRVREPRGLGGGADRHRYTLVVDPRFPGGTATGVAEELAALAGTVSLRVVGLDTAMFRGREVNPHLQRALDTLGLALEWDPPVIRGDTVVFHNPSCLKFDTHLRSRISCTTLCVVTYENFLRPGGALGFDVATCLSIIERAAVAGRRFLVPVSPWNRRGVEEWLRREGEGKWTVAPFDWISVCDFELQPPVAAPRDRRGRHSRPGLEKFPPLAVMRAHFPPHAERCVLLGADGFLLDRETLPRHWRALPFGSMEVGRFLEEIDFFVYFTHPFWRESFGRVIAEATAAGKLVITDPATASIFGPGVVACDGSDVDAVIRKHVETPSLYGRQVRLAQERLADFRPDAFRALVREHMTMAAAPGGERVAERAHAVV